jgi:hypothetical protein
MDPLRVGVLTINDNIYYYLEKINDGQRNIALSSIWNAKFIANQSYSMGIASYQLWKASQIFSLYHIRYPANCDRIWL